MKLTLAEDGSQNTEGDFEAGDSETDEIPCRAEPNSTNEFINGVDGKQVRYDWTVYIPLPIDAIDPGTEIEILNENGDSLGRGTVKRFSKGQLNARAWI